MEEFKPPTGEDTLLKSGVACTIDTRHQCITAMDHYSNSSLEELRFGYYSKTHDYEPPTPYYFTCGERQAIACGPFGINVQIPCHKMQMFARSHKDTRADPLFGRHAHCHANPVALSLSNTNVTEVQCGFPKPYISQVRSPGSFAQTIFDLEGTSLTGINLQREFSIGAAGKFPNKPSSESIHSTSESQVGSPGSFAQTIFDIDGTSLTGTNLQREFSIGAAGKFPNETSSESIHSTSESAHPTSDKNSQVHLNLWKSFDSLAPFKLSASQIPTDTHASTDGSICGRQNASSTDTSLTLKDTDGELLVRPSGTPSLLDTPENIDAAGEVDSILHANTKPSGQKSTFSYPAGTK